jgi:hypothetical protein
MWMDNLYHRYINLPFEIAKPSDEILTYNKNLKTFQNIPLMEIYRCEPMETWLASFGLQILWQEVFYTPPNHRGPIHTDYNDYTNHTKLNITWGTNESVIRWYKSDNVKLFPPVKVEVLNYSHHILLANLKDCEMVYEANTNKPSLVNVGQLHNAVNPSNEGRVTLCFVLGRNKKLLKFSEAIKIFKDYIEGDNDGN